MSTLKIIPVVVLKIMYKKPIFLLANFVVKLQHLVKIKNINLKRLNY